MRVACVCVCANETHSGRCPQWGNDDSLSLICSCDAREFCPGLFKSIRETSRVINFSFFSLTSRTGRFRPGEFVRTPLKVQLKGSAPRRAFGKGAMKTYSAPEPYNTDYLFLSDWRSSGGKYSRGWGGRGGTRWPGGSFRNRIHDPINCSNCWSERRYVLRILSSSWLSFSIRSMNNVMDAVA